MVDKVAILLLNKVYSLPKPYRHHHVIMAMNRRKTEGEKGYPDVQGFCTEEDVFIDRYEGLEIIRATEQEFIEPQFGIQLFSENLWTTPGNWQEPIGHPDRTLYDFYEDHNRIDSLLSINEFDGSIRPYRPCIAIADYFYVERVIIDFDTELRNKRVVPVLYSELFKDKENSKYKLLSIEERLALWKTTFINH